MLKQQLKIPATYMRGGTSKGVFFRLDDLPDFAQSPGAARDRLLLRVIGSPDPYGKHTDGMGGATSSTSKTVILSKSSRPDHDVDYLFGQVSIDRPFIDWSGNCGNLTAAVGSFAISNGLVDPDRIPENGVCRVRIWQANIEKTIIAHVPITDGEVREIGDFELDGVTFPAAEVKIEFLDPAGDAAVLPTGHAVDEVEVPGFGRLEASFINAGIPTIFVRADAIGLTGTELQPAINDHPEQLERLERLRAHGALAMGLIQDLAEAEQRQHTPKIAWVARPEAYVSSSGRRVEAETIDLNVRAMSMGKLHHAMMGTAAVAIAAAAAIPGTLVNQAAGGKAGGSVCFGHPSGTLEVGAGVDQRNGTWVVERVSMSRSARRLMEGWVRVPPPGA